MDLLIFPGIWLLVTASACAVRLDATLAGLLSSLVGTATYVVAARKRTEAGPTIVKRATSLISILVASVLLTRTYYWITWDPTGAIDDGWGNAPGIFQDVVYEWPEVPSRARLAVSIRRTSSGLLSVDVPASYFIFVRPLYQQDNKESLVFRYYATEAGFDAPPQVSWESNDHLIITVGVGDILTVTKQHKEIDGVRITYSLGRSTYNSEVAFWQRPFF